MIEQKSVSLHLKAALDEVIQEAKEACRDDQDLTPIPDQAYQEALSLLHDIRKNLPMPEVAWLVDGGIDFEWRTDTKIFTISLYGDAHIIYSGIFGDQNETRGILPISKDNTNLPSWLAIVISEHFR